MASHRPRFRFEWSTPDNAARVEIFRDRACTDLVAELDGPSVSPTVIPSPTRYGMFGEALASAGDVNGDGYADLLVGSPGETPAAYVYLGGASGFAPTPITLPAQVGPYGNLSFPAVEFGSSVASAGDTDGDGFDEVLVGASQDDVAFVYGGSAGGTHANPASLALGGVLSELGDVNGDGYADAAFASSKLSSVGLCLGSHFGLHSPLLLSAPSTVRALR